VLVLSSPQFWRIYIEFSLCVRYIWCVFNCVLPSFVADEEFWGNRLECYYIKTYTHTQLVHDVNVYYLCAIILTLMFLITVYCPCRTLAHRWEWWSRRQWSQWSVWRWWLPLWRQTSRTSSYWRCTCWRWDPNGSHTGRSTTCSGPCRCPCRTSRTPSTNTADCSPCCTHRTSPESRPDNFRQDKS